MAGNMSAHGAAVKRRRCIFIMYFSPEIQYVNVYIQTLLLIPLKTSKRNAIGFMRACGMQPISLSELD
jgi:hypothetical protein